jgi:hypothetical protein
MPETDKATKYLTEALRTGKNPVNKNLKDPLNLRMRGYQLYTKEQQTLGEPSVSYEEWMKTQQ